MLAFTERLLHCASRSNVAQTGINRSSFTGQKARTFYDTKKTLYCEKAVVIIAYECKTPDQ